jgi:hypothetical protein
MRQHAGPHTNFTLSPLLLDRVLEAHTARYQAATPFPHAVLDGLFSRDALRTILQEVPEQMLSNGCVAGAASCYRRRGTHFRKSELHDESFGPYTRALFETLRSRRFVSFVEKLSGLSGLIPDPGYQGSGVHLTGPQGVLAVHHDFNFMLCRRRSSGGHDRSYTDCSRGASEQGAGQHRLHRRVNVFIYLNEAWPDHYGGHLELWNHNMTSCEQRIAPLFGRFVAFSSTDYSYHGHPQPMALPPNRMRRSIAFYYYTDYGRGAEECDGGECDSFHDAQWQKPRGCGFCRVCGSGGVDRSVRAGGRAAPG